MSNGVCSVKQDRSTPSWSERLAEIGPVLTLGLNFGVALGVGIAFGFAIDRYWGTDPWGVSIGAVFGMAAAIRNAWQILRRSIDFRGR